ncbi:MAG TPA: Spy/CpxP family protein refolding chaperone [Telluria sp.]|nr:Spy/CpxP family protein refolding chaperone [Telluria sp.]
MNTLRKTFLIALAVLGMGGVALAAQAQTTAPEGRHVRAASPEQRQAKMAEFFAAREAKLHDALKLSAAQEPAWSAYQAAIKPPARGTQHERAAMAALPAPQRLEQRIAKAKQHTAGMESRLAALNTFYAVLTPEQKASFDAATAKRHGRGGHGKQGTMQH